MEQTVAIVTGGLRGLGRAMALGLAREGRRVLAIGHIETDVAEIEREIHRTPLAERLHPLVSDLRRAAECDRIVATAEAQFGQIDILVNNAGLTFTYIENNFLAARNFENFDDLNRQALAWCRNVANQKPRRALGMSPEAAYIIEKPHLKPLPDALPPVYELLERVVDLHGYVSVDTNRYSVPERFVGQSVAVYKLPAEIHVCRKDSTIAVHQRLIGAQGGEHPEPNARPPDGPK
jgi:NAD(P)-dependent dehydrogenase (short-subunit alcohol dehydrogenase family)